MNVGILVPVYNEEKIFWDWFPSLYTVANQIGAQIVLIDDGSAIELNKSMFAEKYRGNVVFLRHLVNCGVGAAIQTGFEYAKSHNFNLLLTIDGDGQHDPKDLLSLLSLLKESNLDVVNGSRFLKVQSIPFLRRVANTIGNILTFFLSGYWVSDSQSGMKGFSRPFIDAFEDFSPGYEWCIDVFRISNWNHFSVKETPISVSYNSYTLNKGQSFAIGIDMFFRLCIRSLVR